MFLNLEGSGRRVVSWSSSRKCRGGGLWPGPHPRVHSSLPLEQGSGWVRDWEKGCSFY